MRFIPSGGEDPFVSCVDSSGESSCSTRSACFYRQQLTESHCPGRQSRCSWKPHTARPGREAAQPRSESAGEACPQSLAQRKGSPLTRFASGSLGPASFSTSISMTVRSPSSVSASIATVDGSSLSCLVCSVARRSSPALLDLVGEQASAPATLVRSSTLRTSDGAYLFGTTGCSNLTLRAGGELDTFYRLRWRDRTILTDCKQALSVTKHL